MTRNGDGPGRSMDDCVYEARPLKLQTDQPTGPAVADKIAGMMPGWTHGNHGWHWDQNEWLRRTDDDAPDGCAFRPDRDVADAVEVVGVLNIRLAAQSDRVDAWHPDAPHAVFAAHDNGCAISAAICAAVCGVAVQLPLAREGREDAT